MRCTLYTTLCVRHEFHHLHSHPHWHPLSLPHQCHLPGPSSRPLSTTRPAAMQESEVKRNRHGDFKKVEASRPPWDASRPGFTYTQAPSPSWTFGSGANQLAAGRSSRHVAIDPHAEGRQAAQNYKLLISAVVPRPVALVSTLSGDGATANLAPFSYFQLVNHDPAVFVLGLASGLARAAVGKHTLAHLRDTRECTISLVGEPFVEAANAASVDAPPHLAEWALAGLTPLHDCQTVRPARPAEAVFTAEARLLSLTEFDSRARPGEKSGTLAVLEGTRFWVREDALDENQTLVDPAVLRPISRLGGITYGRTTEGIEIPRPIFEKDVGGIEAYQKIEAEWKAKQKDRSDGKN